MATHFTLRPRNGRFDLEETDMKKQWLKAARLLLVLLLSCLACLTLAACDEKDEPEQEVGDDKVIVTYFTNPDWPKQTREIKDGKFTLKPPPTRPGYTFLGMFDKSTGGSQIVDVNGNCMVEITKSVTLYAQWAPKNVTIRFDAGEGTLSTSETERTLTYGSAVSAFPTATREGYVFLGWRDASGEQCSEGANPIGAHKTATYDSYDMKNDEVTLTAIFEIKRLTMTLDFNDGSYKDETREFNYNADFDKVQLPSKDTGTAYIVAWSTHPTNIVPFSGNITEDLTLYAIWKNYKKVLLDDGQGNQVSIRVCENEPYDLTNTTDMTRPGFVTDGWYDNAQYSGAPITTLTFGSAKDVYYVKWAEATYTVTFTPVDDTTFDSFTYNMGDMVVYPTASREGYTFLGWCKSEALTDTPQLMLTADSYGDMTLYPKFQPKSYGVVLNANGGAVNGTTEAVLTYGQGFTLSIPLRTGYHFVGWFTSPEEDSQKLTNNQGASIAPFTLTEQTQVYAHWSPILYTITFETNGGSAVTPLIGAYGSIVTLPEPPVKAGVLFNGWYNADYSSQYIDTVTVTGNMIVYAMWVESTPITNAEQLKAIASAPNRNYHLVCDINLDGQTWSPIGEFTGILNGNGHKIYNFVLSSNEGTDRLGFIALNQGQVKNLVFENVTFNFQRTSSWSAGGVIVAQNGGQGKITDCTVRLGKMSFTHVGNITKGTTHMLLGNIVGSNAGLIVNCNAYVDMEGTAIAATTTNWHYVNAVIIAGGIAGESSGQILSCKSDLTISVAAAVRDDNGGQWYKRGCTYLRLGGITGQISGGAKIDGCYSASNVTGKLGYQFDNNKNESAVQMYVGGITGYMTSATVSNSYATGSVYSSCRRDTDGHTGEVSCVGGLVGLIGSNGTVENCYVFDNTVSTNGLAAHYAGGLVGRNEGIVRNCYAKGSALHNGSGVTAGFVSSNASTGMIVACFSLDTSFLAESGGTVSNCHTSSDNAFADKADAATLLSTAFLQDTLYWNPAVWVFTEGELPTLLHAARADA